MQYGGAWSQHLTQVLHKIDTLEKKAIFLNMFFL